MARHTLGQYRALIIELDGLVREWEKGVPKADEKAHINAIEAVIEHVLNAVCSRLPAPERVAATDLVKRSELLLARYYGSKSVEYCYVIDHPKFGVIGGHADDNWDVDLTSVQQRASDVRKDWPTRIIARDMRTRQSVEM